MRLSILALVVLVLQFDPFHAFAEPAATNPTVQVTLNLADGTRVIGTTTLTNLPLQSEALGTMALRLDKVRSLKFSPNHESVIVTLANGDQLHGHLGISALTLQTELGGMTVPLEHAMTIDIRPGSVPKPPPGICTEPTSPHPAIQITLDLADGTRVIGTTTLTNLPLQSEASGTMVVPLDKVRSLKFSPNHESVTVTLANGDKLQGRLGISAQTLQTELGVVTVPLEHATAMEIRQGSAPKPPEGLVLWYRFDADEGDRVTDQSGHDNHGRVQNATFVPGGKIGGAMDFSNNDAAIRVGNPLALQLQDFTIALWLKRKSNTRVSPSSAAGLFLGYGQGGYTLGMQDDNLHHGCLLLSKVGLDQVFSRSVVTDTEFHHVAVTKVGQQVVFFVDGVPDHPVFYDTNFEFHTEVAIGSQLHGEAFVSNNFLGAISEVMVFNRALSTEEVKALADSPK